eukprot:scaffold5919_cov118-Isochrysis_galbana.AAC.7
MRSGGGLLLPCATGRRARRQGGGHPPSGVGRVVMIGINQMDQEVGAGRVGIGRRRQTQSDRVGSRVECSREYKNSLRVAIFEGLGRRRGQCGSRPGTSK